MFITGTELRKMRKEAGLTTSEMARLAKVKTRKTYENWEKNVGQPSINQYIMMALGCKVNVPSMMELLIAERSTQDPQQ